MSMASLLVWIALNLITAIQLFVICCCIPLPLIADEVKYEKQECSDSCPKWTYCHAAEKQCEACARCEEGEVPHKACSFPSRCTNKAINSYHSYCPHLCVTRGFQCDVICRPKRTRFGVYLGTVCQISCDEQPDQNQNLICGWFNSTARWNVTTYPDFLSECSTLLPSALPLIGRTDPPEPGPKNADWIYGLVAGLVVAVAIIVVAVTVIVIGATRKNIHFRNKCCSEPAKSPENLGEVRCRCPEENDEWRNLEGEFRSPEEYGECIEELTDDVTPGRQPQETEDESGVGQSENYGTTSNDESRHLISAWPHQGVRAPLFEGHRVPGEHPESTHGGLELQTHGGLELQTHGGLELQTHGGLELQTHGGLELQTHGGLELKTHGGLELQTHGGLELQAHGGLELQTHVGLELKTHVGLELKTHVGLELQTHGGLELQTHGGLELKTHGGLELKTHGGVENRVRYMFHKVSRCRKICNLLCCNVTIKNLKRKSLYVFVTFVTSSADIIVMDSSDIYNKNRNEIRQFQFGADAWITSAGDHSGKKTEFEDF